MIDCFGFCQDNNIIFFFIKKHLTTIKKEMLPILSANQSALGLDINIANPGRHILLVNYVTPEKEWKTSKVSIETSTSSLKNKGVVQLQPCAYDHICRQVSVDKLGRIAIYDFDSNFVGLTLKVPNDLNFKGLNCSRDFLFNFPSIVLGTPRR